MSSRIAPPQSMEQTTLHTMIHERDAQISSLLHQLHSISDNISSLQKELHFKSSARKQQREDHTAAIKKLKEEHAEQRSHLAMYEGKIKGGGGLRVHEYASLMKAANKDVESSYVIRLQAQLCRAMHSLGVMESQLALVKENCSSLIKSMKEDLSHMVDDRTRREIELMNTLAMVDAEKRGWQIEMEKKLREQEELLDSVRDEYEELGLEYDEEEVKRALEIQYLQEQVEKVKGEREGAEKELLAALLEREEQIGKLKDEIADSDNMLKKLKGETGEGADSKVDVANEERDHASGENKEHSDVPSENAPPAEKSNQSDEVQKDIEKIEENVAELSSSMEATHLDEMKKSNVDEITKKNDAGEEDEKDGPSGDSVAKAQQNDAGDETADSTTADVNQTVSEVNDEKDETPTEPASNEVFEESNAKALVEADVKENNDQQTTVGTDENPSEEAENLTK